MFQTNHIPVTMAGDESPETVVHELESVLKGHTAALVVATASNCSNTQKLKESLFAKRITASTGIPVETFDIGDRPNLANAMEIAFTPALFIVKHQPPKRPLAVSMNEQTWTDTDEVIRKVRKVAPMPNLVIYVATQSTCPACKRFKDSNFRATLKGHQTEMETVELDGLTDGQHGYNLAPEFVPSFFIGHEGKFREIQLPMGESWNTKGGLDEILKVARRDSGLDPDFYEK